MKALNHKTTGRTDHRWGFRHRVGHIQRVRYAWIDVVSRLSASPHQRGILGVFNSSPRDPLRLHTDKGTFASSNG